MHNDRRMIRNPDTSPDQPAIIFTNSPQEYDDDKFVTEEMKAGITAKVPSFFFFFYVTC